MSKRQTVCLTIAGLDPSGGAGVIADIRTFEVFGCRAAAAVTSITFQNSKAVYGSVHLTGEQVADQIEPVFEELDIAAIKIGLLPTADIVRSVASTLKGHDARHIVIDPVMVSSSGFELLESDAVSAIVTDLFPLATLVTPNIPEAERISGISITDDRSLKRAAQAIQHAGARNVLIKGGHVETNSPLSRDLLFIGDNISVFEASRLKNASVRGTGCMLSSAIAANLALGNELRTAVGIAKDHVHEVIAAASGSEPG